MAFRRTLAGVLLGALFIALMVMTTLSQTQTECEVCLTFEGRSECATAHAANRDEAVGQAKSSTCGLLAAGVTQAVRCSQTVPTDIRCTESSTP